MALSNSRNIFITNYLMNLKERTRKEKKGDKYGFDLIIYNLAINKGWTPQRLSFFREKDGLICKTEAEFGVDQSFILPNKQELVIFTLKDEKLNKTNWHKENFLIDLEDACLPDLSSKELDGIKKVRVILAYNKDEDRAGEELFKRFKSSKEGTKIIAQKADLIIEKWNLSKIAEEVTQYLLTPDLLPQHLSGELSYIYSQFNDFKYNSQEWENQLIPNWKDFLKKILSGKIEENKIRLIPVVLSILHQSDRSSKSDTPPALLDLTEWAMLSLWNKYIDLNNSKNDVKQKNLIIRIWFECYIEELEKYFAENESTLMVEHGLHSHGTFLRLNAINDAYLAYWHIGRIGILNLAFQTYDFGEQTKTLIAQMTNKCASWLFNLLLNNPGSYRPLLDINHIEIFLIWLIFVQAGNLKQLYLWLSELENCLLMRRASTSTIPFIESRNRLDLVAEYAAMSEKPLEYLDTSSNLLLMILELCCSIPEKNKRNYLFNRYINRIILGKDNSDNPFTEDKIDIFTWIPPENWSKKVFSESVTDGISIQVVGLNDLIIQNIDMLDYLNKFVNETRAKHPYQFNYEIPYSAYILACIKNKSPLPPEFWRSSIFPQNQYAPANKIE